MVLFGQVIIGPPGCGKTTYCIGMKMFLNELNRKCDIINLDYSNDSLPYECSIDVRDLISLQDTMEEHQLGPNGGLLYCMEYLLQNIEWLEEKIMNLKTHYIIFDCPGQVELYTHHSSFQQILTHLSQHMNAKLCSVQLIDSYYCTQPSTFISAVLLATSTMLKLGLPHVNILSKIDLLASYGYLPFNLDFFTECMNLSPLLRYLHNPIVVSSNDTTSTDHIDGCSIEEEGNCNNIDNDTNNNNNNNNNNVINKSKLQIKYHKMSQSLCDVIDDYGLVSFLPMNIEDVETVGKVLAAIDNANGYSMAALEISEWYKTQNINDNNNNNLNSNSSNNNNNNHGTSNYDLFKIASKHLESTYSLDIQEKYGINDMT